MKKIAIFLFASFFYLLSWGQDTLFIDQEKQEFKDLSSYLTICEDTTNQFSIDSILSNSSVQFKAINPKEKLNPHNSYWAKLSVKSLLAFDKNYVVLWNSLSVMRLNFLEAYIYQEDKQLCNKKFGFFLKRSELIGTKYWDRFSLRLSHGSSFTIYFRIKNEYNYPPTFNLSIEEPEEYLIRQSNQSVLYLFYEGMLCIMILYNLLVFLYTLDRAYLYYSLYMMSSAVYTLYFQRYILSNFIPEMPEANAYFWLTSLGLGTAFYFMFIRHFLNTRVILSTWWNMAISAIVILKIVIVLAEVIYYSYFKNVRELTDFVSISIIIETSLSIVLLVKLLRTKKKTVYFFMGGAVCLWIGIFTSTVFYQIGVENAQQYARAGVILEVLIFSLGLGYRMRQTEIEKNEANKQLIEQLRKNDELQARTNQELEEQVKARTAEIRSQQEEIQVQNETLQETNRKLNTNIKHVRDSIVYAQRIQEAVMPQSEEFENFLREYFIYFKPRDIVSGDFYWVKQIRGQLLIAAIDCTGHGVPGAFLSLLGISFLNEISSNLLSSDKEFKANHILDLLRDKVKESLKQHRNIDTSSKEAMDMALCIIDKDKKQMQFAGARNPLYLLRNRQIIEFKGDRMPISASRHERPFSNRIIDIQPNDMFYLFTDGVTDQFGGINGVKLYPKGLKQILSTFSNIPLNKQHLLFDRAFQDWKQNNIQVDDTLLIGFKV